MQSVSVVICTYNRAAFLADTLRTLAPVVAAYAGPAEVLIVNNASTDSTEDVVRNFIAQHPLLGISLVQEERQGLSFARNTGIEHAQGDVICFLDDDVYVSEGWLTGLLSAFSISASIGCAAGRTMLHWPDMPCPGWIDHRYVGILSEFEFGDRSFVFGKGDVFVGANFALTREAVAAVGGFDPGLGRKRALLLSGEDTDYAKRLWERGFSIAYAADGCIRHRVLPEQLTYSWFSRRYFWSGVTAYLLRREWYYPLSGVPRLLTSAFLFLAGALVFSKRRMALSSFRVINSVGAFYGWYLQTMKKNIF